MAIYITDECINCGACEPECPNNAIYDGGIEWSYADGTGVSGVFTLVDGQDVEAEKMEGVTLGQTVVIVYAEALALSLEQAAAAAE